MIDNKLELDFERISILYSNTQTAHIGMAISVTFLYFVIFEYASPDIAKIWAIAVFAAFLPRIILSFLFKNKLDKRQITTNNVRPWEHYYFLSSILPYLCVSSVFFIPYGENIFIGTLFCAVIVFACIAGSTLINSTSKKLAMLFIIITMLSLITKCFLINNFLFNLLGFVLICAGFILVRLIFRQNRILLENITLKIENKNHSLKDPLTNLWNRRRLYLYIDTLIPATRRSGEPFSIILLDIDYFKKYNDTHGHSAGDEILKKVSICIQQCSREQDLIVRYGGEEFMLILPSTNIDQAKIITERIRATIKENTEVSVSAGLAVYSDKKGFDELVKQADTALYAAKKAGRDRFMIADNVYP